MNNALMNRLLLASDQDGILLVKALLGHLLQVAAMKGLSGAVIGIMGKLIALVKILHEAYPQYEHKVTM